MAWRDHPVNEARAAVAPSTRWLYGGARLAHRAARTSADPGRPGRAPQRAGDWAYWLDALPALDAQLRARSGKQGLPDAPTELLLLGDDRSVALTLKPRGSLLELAARAQENWSAWWSHPA